jgi:hypothetical protein
VAEESDAATPARSRSASIEKSAAPKKPSTRSRKPAGKS